MKAKLSIFAWGLIFVDQLPNYCTKFVFLQFIGSTRIVRFDHLWKLNYMKDFAQNLTVVYWEMAFSRHIFFLIFEAPSGKFCKDSLTNPNRFFATLNPNLILDFIEFTIGNLVFANQKQQSKFRTINRPGIRQINIVISALYF